MTKISVGFIHCKVAQVANLMENSLRKVLTLQIDGPGLRQG